MQKPKAPALRNFGNETASIGSLASAAFSDRSPALADATTRTTQQLARTATNARQRELSALQTWAARNVTPTATAVRGEYDAARARLDDIERRLGNPGALESAMTARSLADLEDPDSELMKRLRAEAMADLDLGRSLSEEQAMTAQQQARAGFAARGMAAGTPAALAEVLNRDAYGTARQNERRGFAGNVEQMGQQNRNSARQFALGTNAQTLQREGMRSDAGFRAADAMQRTADFNWRSSPAVIAMTQPSMVPQAMSTAAQLTSQADVYPQLLGYGSDLFNTNFNARESRYLSDINRYYAQKYGGYGNPAGGTGGINAGGAAMGALSGAASGAMIGSVVPGIGTAVGALGGGLLGGLGGGLS